MIWVSLVLAGLGILAIVAGFFIVFYSAFRTSYFWGFVCCVPFGVLVYIPTHWKRCSEGAGLFVIGLVTLVVGRVILM